MPANSCCPVCGGQRPPKGPGFLHATPCALEVSQVASRMLRCEKRTRRQVPDYHGALEEARKTAKSYEGCRPDLVAHWRAVADAILATRGFVHDG